MLHTALFNLTTYATRLHPYQHPWSTRLTSTNRIFTALVSRTISMERISRYTASLSRRAYAPIARKSEADTQGKGVINKG